jgi:hypothetical protein
MLRGNLRSRIKQAIDIKFQANRVRRSERIGFLLLVLLVLALLWPSKRRTALVFVGLIAVLAAIVVLAVELING